ncbi:MAG: cell wall hydrolase [Faecousia sp.]
MVLVLAAAANIAVMPARALGTTERIPEESVTLTLETVPQDDAQTPEEADQTTEPDQTSPVQTVPTEEENTASVPAQEPDEAEPEEPEESSPSMRNGFPLFLQTDYPDVRYGSGTMATSGCSITCLAMVATYMTGHTYYPDELAGYFGGHVGSNIDRLEYASDMLQLPWKKAGNWHEALAALKEGKIVIILMNSRSAFTEGQHFIVATGLTEDGKVLVNDPSGPNYTKWQLKDGFENGFHPTTISNGYSGSWIYDPQEMPEEPFIYEEEEIEVECRYPGLELTQEETELLARMVWVEAQGEPVEGQQAVAEVVLNRLAADNFPDTLKGVIYAADQFRSTEHLDEAKPTQTQYEAVERALNGPYVVPKDVVFFATYPVNNSVWGKIGGHTFCYQWGMDPEE